MIVNPAPKDLAIMHNVNSVGEFRIKNSHRAFEILSSGLYSNKVLAIIRELSCNAYDSHVAAGRRDQSFDVHLPNQLEPWFSIRDYGIGLTHDQVVNIYTTYFETTKSDSNDYIGALGLGSKSPFSYTNNFTVIAIKDHRRGIYTAFINDLGVPSIALMYEEDTNEPNGLEVRFAVTNSSDYYVFLKNARDVYTYFEPKPIVGGVENFIPYSKKYDIKNIVNGVHSLVGSGYAYAVMGNVAYPIDVPERQQRLGELSNLLNCNLEFNFAIGELDVQASREGLAYTEKTIKAIADKLTFLSKGLTAKLTEEVDQLENIWFRAQKLVDLGRQNLWTASVREYLAITGFQWVIGDYYRATFKETGITSKDLASKFNISANWFFSNKNTIRKKRLAWNSVDADYNTHVFTCEDYRRFVVNDTNIGAVERAKHHWRTVETPSLEFLVCVLDVADRSVPAKFDEFFEFIGNPPKDYVYQASDLTKKAKDQKISLGSILQLFNKSENEVSWKKACIGDVYDASQTYYYIPLSGFSFISKYGYKTVNAFIRDIKAMPITVPTLTPYGVRKSEIEAISALSNWVNLEDYVAELIKSIDPQVIDTIVKSAVKSYSDVPKTLLSRLSDFSAYKQLVIELDISPIRGYYEEIQRIFNRFAPGQFDIEQQVVKLNQKVKEVEDKYPLLNYIYVNGMNVDAVAEYINLIDTR